MKTFLRIMGKMIFTLILFVIAVWCFFIGAAILHNLFIMPTILDRIFGAIYGVIILILSGFSLYHSVLNLEGIIKK